MCGSAKDDGTGLAFGAATELDHLLLANHDLLDELAGSKGDGTFRNWSHFEFGRQLQIMALVLWYQCY